MISTETDAEAYPITSSYGAGIFTEKQFSKLIIARECLDQANIFLFLKK